MHQLLSVLHVLCYLILSANLEVGTVAFCILKMRKLKFKPKKISSKSHGEYVAEPGFDPSVCLTSKPVLLTTEPQCSFQNSINLRSSEPFTTFVPLTAASCCLPPASFKTRWGAQSMKWVPLYIERSFLQHSLWAASWYGTYRDGQCVAKEMPAF